MTAQTREQGRRLRRLRTDRDIGKPALCSRLGFNSTQTYDLYERGVSIIRMDRIQDWAEAFEMTREDFIEAVLSDDQMSHQWSFRDALRGKIPEWLIDDLAAEWEGRPIVNQRAAVQGILQMAESQRRRNTSQNLDTHAV